MRWQGRVLVTCPHMPRLRKLLALQTRSCPMATLRLLSLLLRYAILLCYAILFCYLVMLSCYAILLWYAILRFICRFQQQPFSNHAFSVAGPRCWNSIPTSIRSAYTLDSFKSRLKMFTLFREGISLTCDVFFVKA